jgi:TatD DNase family protein
MITDSHCHLASHRYADQDVGLMIARANSAGVHRMVTLSTSLGDLSRNLEIANHAGVSAAIGIHPCDVHQAPDHAIEILSGYVTDPRICAIGETGLDYFHPAPDGWTESDFRMRQQDFLKQHFELAARSGLNVVIHTRDREGSCSFQDALDIYRKYSDRVRAVFHCFVSSWDLAQQVLAEGGLVSFGGVTTFKKTDSLKDTVAKCPPGFFMLETDSPYLAPEPMRGKQNEPAFASYIAEVVAAVRGESLAELAEHTERAANDFFRWKSNSAE